MLELVTKLECEVKPLLKDLSLTPVLTDCMTGIAGGDLKKDSTINGREHIVMKKIQVCNSSFSFFPHTFTQKDMKSGT